MFFAFALGGFVGLQAGLISGASDNNTLWGVSTAFFGTMLGIAFSRIVVRAMTVRGLIKPRPQRKVR